jgi:hypothetical protein
MAMTLILDAGGGDTLDLMDDTKHFVGATNGQQPEELLDWSEPGLLRVPLMITGASPTQIASNVSSIERMLSRAKRAWRESRSRLVVATMAQGQADTLDWDLRGGKLWVGQIAPDEGDLAATLDLWLASDGGRGDAVAWGTTGTLTNGAAAFLVEDVPGDRDAWTKLVIRDVSTAGKIVQRVRVARRSGQALALGDFDPVVDCTAVSPATLETSEGFGGNFARRSVSGTVALPIARAVMPAGALNRGEFDVLARVRDGAVVMSAPSGLGKTDVNPAAQTTVVSTPREITRRQNVLGSPSSGTSFSATWDQATLDGSLLLLWVFGPSVTCNASTMPSGWRRRTLTNAGSFSIALYYKRNAPSESSTGNFTFATSGQRYFVAQEQTNAASGDDPGVYAVEGGGTVTFTLPFDITYAFNALAQGQDPNISSRRYNAEADTWDESPVVTPGQRAIVAVCRDDGNADLDEVYNGFEVIASNNGMVISEASVGGTTIVRFLGFDDGATIDTEPWDALIVTLIAATDSVSSTTGIEPTPGDLVAAVRNIRVQGIDATGNTTNATSSVASTITADGGRVDLSWSAPANGTPIGYRITWERVIAGQPTLYFELDTPTNATTYSITTEENVAMVAALPATSGAVASPNAFRASVGTPNGDVYQEWEATVSEQLGAWHNLLLGTIDAQLIPPLLDGTVLDWAIQVDGLSSGGPAANLDVDYLFLAPHDEAVLELWHPTLALDEQVEWVAETHPSGRFTICYARDKTTGAEEGLLAHAGVLTLAPLDDILAVELDVGGGVDDVVDAKCTVNLTYYPRHSWHEGA